MHFEQQFNETISAQIKPIVEQFENNVAVAIKPITQQIEKHVAEAIEQEIVSPKVGLHYMIRNDT